MPLPSPKALWEARDVEAWHDEAEMETKSNRVFALLDDGQLVRKTSQDDGEHETDTAERTYKDSYTQSIWQNREKWSDFIAGADAFGYLIMITASVV